MNPRRQHRNDEGFTLIELLIVMSIMLVLMAIAIPNALKLYKQANETSAQASVKTIGQAEMQYNSAYPQNGFSCGLAALGEHPAQHPPPPPPRSSIQRSRAAPNLAICSISLTARRSPSTIRICTQATKSPPCPPPPAAPATAVIAWMRTT